MKAARLLPPLLAGATVILLGANAFPTVQRRHRLMQEKNRLVHELREERARGRILREHVDAIENDRFYLQRMFAETWRGIPRGAIEWKPQKDWD